MNRLHSSKDLLQEPREKQVATLTVLSESDTRHTESLPKPFASEPFGTVKRNSRRSLLPQRASLWDFQAVSASCCA